MSLDDIVSFSEDVPETLETERGRKNVITVCNGTDVIIYVELNPIEVVRRLKARQKDFGVGVDSGVLQGNVGLSGLWKDTRKNSRRVMTQGNCSRRRQ